MGIIGVYENELVEIEEFRQGVLLSCAGVHRRKDQEEFSIDKTSNYNYESDGDRLVCVTSGVSFLGLAIVNRLLMRGYYVRLIITNEEELRQMEMTGEMMNDNNNISISATVADYNNVESLSKAFSGCRGVFHTAALVDPSGLSGYSKSMVDIEVKACENIMEACARTSSVRKCVLTSSLLACIWRNNSTPQLSSTVDHKSWTDESICIQKKLWYALGKLRAEKAAWNIADKGGFKLVTVCPGLITGPRFFCRNPTASIAYLKGAREMYADGLLATSDVHKLAEAQLYIYEAMNKTASGRYICYNHVIRSEEEIEKLAMEMGMPHGMLGGNENVGSFRFELSNVKISRLMLRTLCRNE